VFLPLHLVSHFVFSTEISCVSFYSCVLVPGSCTSLGSWNSRKLGGLLLHCDFGGNYLGAFNYFGLFLKLMTSLELLKSSQLSCGARRKVVWVWWPPSESHSGLRFSFLCVGSSRIWWTIVAFRVCLLLYFTLWRPSCLKSYILLSHCWLCFLA
jgi:hypothetical protein